MSEVYTPSKGNSPSISHHPLDPTYCKAGVWSKERWATYAQCARKAGVDGWCKQHHPNATDERSRAATEKFEASQRRQAMGWHGEAMMAALIKIRDGDNDPRTTATEVLSGIKYAANSEQPK